jgi:hypothetical protein
VRGELPGVPDIRDPSTTSPHLLATRKTAHTGQPVSEFWPTALFRGLPVTARTAARRPDRRGSPGFVNPALYRIASTPLYHTTFHDITTGKSTVEFSPQTFTGYQATRGWDPVTGLGSPDVQVLVPLLARYASR